ncbi:hypothetical protein CEE69_07895 [Rhodopirellula bahusiensis]|uniref:Uncharacterized protein n=1 Tax=Rhodopirellula bahusiensis TaxID=2014065 RepID=A0A2G1WA89_9BACT|nr:hypothetical protein CEE69_07895 [Rhodopirellula bahusiensis]
MGTPTVNTACQNGLSLSNIEKIDEIENLNAVPVPKCTPRRNQKRETDRQQTNPFDGIGFANRTAKGMEGT